MAGHSKWANIKHKKGREDAKRGKIFTKLIKEVTVAARMGGGDPSANPRLRSAIAAARAENMPKDTLERAIKRGTGELEGVNYEDIVYEGYGPGGAAVIVESLTDNKNRAIAEIRHIFTKCGGNIGANGCVSWMFDKKGLIVVSKDAVDEEALMETAIEAGAEDVKDEGESFEVITAPEDFNEVKEAIDGASIATVMSEVTMIPQNMCDLEGKEAEKMVRMMDMLDDCDDVQNVHTNADIPDDLA
ncbi:YebC/PmpR family DNA-binding transcriptional regulator [Desulfoluna spongiiphila]|uniref:Probable transcriptional regulatory protein SAMN05216233_12142 n=1 Tax=Desulfoluna spongiiphila TaxID=419481 RepID=A0A1G5IQW5_9BACT|nr:YebC/PmpR family DNA-binding transcriptional regulator [Desulfoluna spongiiphila]SCY78009.1 DNA-binding regulatory protein, YebC/PmpR family [Desulfoluna spongiiphila]VVS92578.1 transcriptional regulator taco1-like [Desulfoluna spongiiphila]